MLITNEPKVSKTRFAGLGYSMQSRGLWRFIDLDTGATIGSQYPTKADLLADVSTFAQERGFTIN